MNKKPHLLLGAAYCIYVVFTGGHYCVLLFTRGPLMCPLFFRLSRSIHPSSSRLRRRRSDSLSLSLKSPAAGQRRDQWDVLASKQVVRGSGDEDDELTEEEFLRFHVLCVILSLVLRFSRSLHPGVCNKRKKTLLILCYALLMWALGPRARFLEHLLSRRSRRRRY